MPNQVIAGTLSGTSDISAIVTSPRYVMGDAAGRAHLMAWLNESPLPAMTATGESEAEMGHLALGHLLAFDQSPFLDIGGSFQLGIVVGDPVGLTFDPAVIVMSGSFQLRAGVTLDFGF